MDAKNNYNPAASSYISPKQKIKLNSTLIAV